MNFLSGELKKSPSPYRSPRTLNLAFTLTSLSNNSIYKCLTYHIERSIYTAISYQRMLPEENFSRIEKCHSSASGQPFKLFVWKLSKYFRNVAKHKTCSSCFSLLHFALLTHWAKKLLRPVATNGWAKRKNRYEEFRNKYFTAETLPHRASPSRFVLRFTSTS